ncbi:30S ribosomal protein S6 [soil metagenome]
MRAYELMLICDADLDESAVAGVMNQVSGEVEAKGGTVASTDKWGRRRFAYEINHKTEGSYVVFEILAEPGALDDLDRLLRRAYGVVRHKLIRLPDHEAARRGLLGEQATAPAVSEA